LPSGAGSQFDSATPGTGVGPIAIFNEPGSLAPLPGYGVGTLSGFSRNVAAMFQAPP
jgi:hypothetical protein